ncbi:hypothetical protein LPJ72_003981 [Coemansia sp. Benny D160-2]|nr:hypothetical protein LPJ72_003981 [Coemansia sp. Benny D160-2]
MPKKKVENRLKTILTRCDVEQDPVDWKATPLTERNVKFRVLTLAMRHIRLPISNRALNNIQTVGDLLEEFDQKPVTTDAGHPVAAFYKENADQLPANMKFEPFQGRNSRTHVHQ